MKTIALYLLFAAVISASPAGILAWTGDPFIGYCSATESNCGALYGPLRLINDPSGITSTYNAWEGAGSIETSYSVGRAFTVTSPGDFLFTSSVALSGEGEQCSPIGFCGGMRLGFTSGGFPGTTDLGGSTNGSAFDGLVSGTLTANGSDILFLASGDYTLWQGMNADLLTEGSASLGLTYSTDVVGIDPPDPVPEPHYHLWIVGVALVVRSALKK